MDDQDIRNSQDSSILNLDYGHEDYGHRRIMVMVESGFYCYGSGFQDSIWHSYLAVFNIQSEWVGRTT